jgi:hypothetical protein
MSNLTSTGKAGLLCFKNAFPQLSCSERFGRFRQKLSQRAPRSRETYPKVRVKTLPRSKFTGINVNHFHAARDISGDFDQKNLAILYPVKNRDESALLYVAAAELL